VINIAGLAIGLASALLIVVYVKEEVNYDKFHVNKDRIFRIAEEFKTGEGSMQTGLTPARLAQAMKDYFPQIEKTARIDYDLERYRVEYQSKSFDETRITAVDPDFFSIFSFELLSGDPQKILREPYSMVISDVIAKKYFGSEDPAGKVMKFIDTYSLSSFDVQVSGVFRSMPTNSHVHKDFLLSNATTEKFYPGREDQWGWTSHFTYFMLAPGHEIDEIEKAMPEFINKMFSKEFGERTDFFIQPLTDIHLRSSLKEELEPNGDIHYVYVFTTIALVILLLASINYMNLATARASRRAKEIGIRKVVGAVKSKVIYQFLGESILVTLVALFFAVIIAQLFTPLFNSLSGKEISIDFTNVPVLASFFTIAIILGILSGTYPALILSSFKPVDALRAGITKVGNGAMFLRKGLVILQFSLSTALIIGTMIIFMQWNFLQEKKLGIDSDQIIVVPMSTRKIDKQNMLLKSEWLKNSNIESVTASNKRLTERPGNYTMVKLKESDKSFALPLGIVDYDFFKTFNIPILQGRDFSAEVANDTVDTYIINEAAAKLLGIKDPVGASVVISGRDQGTIVGVVKDFHFESLHTQISPYLFFVRPAVFNYFAVRVKSKDIQETIGFMESTYLEIDPDGSFTWTFLDDDIQSLYKSEQNFFQVFTTFSILAIVIACLGIFGLISFTTAQRTKEISIRKILGASVKNISLLLTKDFIKLILIATLISWPFAYYFMNNWLENFSYQITLNGWIFIGATFLSLIIAVATISVQAIHAALANPVDSLKNE
jgi:putative ABC transport system permease protein